MAIIYLALNSHM